MPLGMVTDFSPASLSSPAGTTAFPLVTAPGALPNGATQLSASSGNVAAAAAVATLTSAAGRTAFLTGFEVTGSGSSTALPVTVTVTGLLGGTLSYTYTFIAGVLLANTPLIIEFPTPLQASAVNTNIVVTCPSGGLGNTNNTTNAHGFLI